MHSFNKYGLNLQWPRIWILIIAILMIFLTFCIAGMEIGHTIYDLYRSTAFGGFITFLPLLICAIIVLITAFKSHLCLVRIAVVLCFLMILLCMALIAYDILVIIDPTRCFFLDCSAAIVNNSNSTTNIFVTGWPIYISWPSYFQTAMTAKQIFQSIQIGLAALYILLAILYILTYFIYRRANLYEKTNYIVDSQQMNSSAKNSNHIITQNDSHGQIMTYMITGDKNSSAKYHSSVATPVSIGTQDFNIRKSKSAIRPRTSSVNQDRICTKCLREPRVILNTNFERQNYFSHLCSTCNNELIAYHQKPMGAYSSTNRTWVP